MRLLRFVREVAEGKPVEIGRLQRYATDALMAKGGHPFTRAAPTDAKSDGGLLERVLGVLEALSDE